MKKFILFSILFLITGSDLFAQSNNSATNDKALVWSISGNGLQSTSYIMGTIHIICKDDFFWNTAMEKALNNTQKVCLEMDMDDPTLQMEVAKGMMLPVNKSLKDFFTDKEYTHLSQYAQDSLGLPSMILDRMKPVAIMMMMSLQNFNCKNKLEYETVIMDSAHTDNKEIIGLESAEDQFATLDNINQDTVVNSIKRYLNGESQDDATELNKMVQAYTSQDLPALYNIIIKSDEFKSDIDGLLYKRNANWIPKMQAIMKNQATLFAVGAGHLWGAKGVIALLRKAGYTVQPVH